MSHDQSQPPPKLEPTSESKTSATKSPGVPIFGSVSTADIAEQVKTVLRETTEGARVVLGTEDVTILNDGGGEADLEADRLKELGDFPVEIQVKNGTAVRRIVRIIARER